MAFYRKSLQIPALDGLPTLLRIKINTLSAIAVFIPFLGDLTASLGERIVFLEKLSDCYLFLSDREFFFFD